MPAKFEVTEALLPALVRAVEATGRNDVSFRLSESEDDWDDSTDDSIEILLNGEPTHYDLQSGPYGLSLNESIMENGLLVGVRQLAAAPTHRFGTIVKDVMAKLDEILPGASRPTI